jgi:oligopeptide transport system ATP-binding protein
MKLENMSAKKILEVKDLKTHFFTRRGVVKAVDGVSFHLDEGETLGLVGESGCGKSVTCFSIIRLVEKPAGEIVGGEVLFEGKDLLHKTEKEMDKFRGEQISMVLQDPMTSLNPLFTIGYQVAEPIEIHQNLDKKNVLEKVLEMLRNVRIPSPELRVNEFPHQMSGGMRQRIISAMALSCEPKILIADEPTTALDVTIQAQFLRLLKEIQQQSNLSMIIVTHDFGIVAKACDRVAVMYAGKIVETGTTMELFDHPTHPYTIALMNSLPKVGAKVKRLYSIDGQPPDLSMLGPGCAFAPRCPEAMDICLKEYPPQSTISEGHIMRCWLSEQGTN